MSLVCPRCSALHNSPEGCPRCGARPLLPDVPTHDGPIRWQHSTWGRILIGLVLSQGLFYGLRHLLTGVLMAVEGGTSQDVWGTVHGAVLLQAAQFLGLFLGGIMAGGGQRWGLALGAMVGVWNGVLATLLRQNPSQPMTVVSLVGAPLVHAACGAAGGWLGALIWAPIPQTVAPGLAGVPRKKARRAQGSALSGKVAWLRVLVGTSLAVVGTLSATMLFEKVLELGAGKLGTTTDMQDRLITWEIRALALLVGGALAGATTPNGVKQGLFVGLFSCMILMVAEGHNSPRWLEIAGLTLVSCFTLSLVGGWFGGALFPPVIKVPRGGLGRALLS